MEKLAGARKRRFSVCRNDVIGYLFLLPELVIFTIFFIYPILRGVVLSFYDFGVNHSEFVAFRNYLSVFKDKLFYQAFWNTTVYTVLTLVPGLLIALILAALLFPLSGRLQSFFKAAYYLPGVLSGAVVAITWKWIMDPNNGVLNGILESIGLEPCPWLTHPDTAMVSLALIALLGGQGQSIIVLLANMGSIDPTIYESAKLDGSSPATTFFRITVPLLRPTILYLSVTGLIRSYVVFENIYLITNGGPAFSTTTVAYLIYSEAFGYFDFGRASAISTILFVFIMVMSFLQFKFLGKEK